MSTTFPRGPLQNIIDIRPTWKMAIAEALLEDPDAHKFFKTHHPDYTITQDGLLLYNNMLVIPVKAEVVVDEPRLTGNTLFEKSSSIKHMSSSLMEALTKPST